MRYGFVVFVGGCLALYERGLIMLDFNEEINKYRPILNVSEIEDAINADDVKDVMDLITHLIKQIVSLRPGKLE